ncbi:MAG TPA: tetratricopeptide repeat protein [Vicinamibacterales bacterium]|jgi:tetratricopeptide (TPR) repeat protein|nr:tetratricopeptide repeat protein [Vicinamibacterales bacterium]
MPETALNRPCRVAAALALIALVVAPPPARAAERLLVVPLENNRNEPSIYWLSEASAILLADNLNALGVSAITRPERVRAFETLHLPASATLSRATLIRVGELAGASGIVVGTIERQEQQLIVRARTIRLDSGRLNPEVVERGALADLFGVFERVARKLLGRSADGPALESRPPLLAFENYVKGLVAESPAAQERYLQRAVELYKEDDRAWLALWEVWTEAGQHEKALQAARTVPAGSRFARRARFRAGLSELELGRDAEAFTTFKALDSERPAPELRNNLGIVQLRRGGTAETGRSTWFFTLAADADKDDPDYCFNLGYAYALENDTAAAVYWLREAVRRNPADGDAHLVLGAVLEARGSSVEAARERELARQLSSKYNDASGPAIPKGLERIKTTIDLPRAQRVESTIATPAERDQRELAAFHLDRGRRLYEELRDREALGELQKSIYLSPYQAQAQFLVGRIHLRNGRVREAIDALTVSIWIEDTPAARDALAEARRLLPK